MAFRWRADHVPLIVVIGSFLSQLEKNNVVEVGPPLTKLSGSAHGPIVVHLYMFTWCHQECLYRDGVLIEIFKQLKLLNMAFMIANNKDTGHMLPFCGISFGSSLVPDIQILTMG